MCRDRIQIKNRHCSAAVGASLANVSDSKIVVCFITAGSVGNFARFHVVDRHRLGHVLVGPLVEALLNRVELFLNLVLELLLDFPVDPVLLIFEILESIIVAGRSVACNQIGLMTHLDETAVQLLFRRLLDLQQTAFDIVVVHGLPQQFIVIDFLH